MMPQPHVLPDALRGDEVLEGLRVGHDVDAVVPVLPQQLREDARAAEELLEHGDDQHPGEEVRQVEDRLRHRPHPGSDHTVDEQRESDRDREVQHELEEEQHQCVLDRLPERRVLEEALEVLQAHPGAVQDGDDPVVADVGVVVLEGDHVAEDRQVVEDQDQDDRGQRHQQQDAVAPEPGPQAQPARGPSPPEPVAAPDSAGVLSVFSASGLLRGTVLWDTAVLLASPPVSPPPCRSRRAASGTSRGAGRRPSSSSPRRPPACRRSSCGRGRCRPPAARSRWTGWSSGWAR